MPCVTCGHTIQKLNDRAPIWYSCPRCGTLMSFLGDQQVSYVPTLVDRARDLVREVVDTVDGIRPRLMRRVTNVADSCVLPDERNDFTLPKPPTPIAEG